MSGGKQSSAKSAKKRKRNTEADTVQAKRLRAAKTDLFKSLQKKISDSGLAEFQGASVQRSVLEILDNWLGVILGDPTRYQTFREWLAEAQTDRPHVPVPGSSAYYTVGDALISQMQTTQTAQHFTPDEIQNMATAVTYANEVFNGVPRNLSPAMRASLEAQSDGLATLRGAFGGVGVRAGAAAVPALSNDSIAPMVTSSVGGSAVSVTTAESDPTSAYAATTEESASVGADGSDGFAAAAAGEKSAEGRKLEALTGFLAANNDNGLLYDTYDNFQYNQLLDSLQVLQDDALVPHLSPRSAMVADGPGAAPHDAPSLDGIDGFDILGLDALTGGSLVMKPPVDIEIVDKVCDGGCNLPNTRLVIYFDRPLPAAYEIVVEFAAQRRDVSLLRRCNGHPLPDLHAVECVVPEFPPISDNGECCDLSVSFTVDAGVSLSSDVDEFQYYAGDLLRRSVEDVYAGRVGGGAPPNTDMDVDRRNGGGGLPQAGGGSQQAGGRSGNFTSEFGFNLAASEVNHWSVLSFAHTVALDGLYSMRSDDGSTLLHEIVGRPSAPEGNGPSPASTLQALRRSICQANPESLAAFANVKNRNGDTALHLAAASGNLRLVAELLQVGANARLVDATGRTAHMIAAGAGKPVVFVVLNLVARGWNVKFALELMRYKQYLDAGLITSDEFLARRNVMWSLTRGEGAKRARSEAVAAAAAKAKAGSGVTATAAAVLPEDGGAAAAAAAATEPRETRGLDLQTGKGAPTLVTAPTGSRRRSLVAGGKGEPSLVTGKHGSGVIIRCGTREVVVPLAAMSTADLFAHLEDEFGVEGRQLIVHGEGGGDRVVKKTVGAMDVRAFLSGAVSVTFS